MQSFLSIKYSVIWYLHVIKNNDSISQSDNHLLTELWPSFEPQVKQQHNIHKKLTTVWYGTVIVSARPLL